MANWDLCFICQRSINEDLRSSNDGLDTLATNIPKFNEFGRLKFDYSRIANENENLLSILKANNAKYHNTCQSSYSESKFKTFQLSNEKQFAKASQKESENQIPQKWSRRSAEEPGPSHVNKCQCCWCNEFDDEANLRAAGQRWAKTKPNSEDVKNITHKWKIWLQLSNTNISCVRWATVMYQVISCFITPPVSQTTPTNITAS